MSLSPRIGSEALHFPTSPVDMMVRNVWTAYPGERSGTVLGTLSSSKKFPEFQIPETVTSYSSQMTKT